MTDLAPGALRGVAPATPAIDITPPGTPLDASIALDGGKHAFAHSLAGAALAEWGVLRNVPDHIDAQALRAGLRTIFDDVRYDPGTRVLEFGDPRHGGQVVLPPELTSRSRSLFCLYPALLLRADEVVVHAAPRGCAIGTRPTAWYLQVLEQFGVRVDESDRRLRMRWPRRRAARIEFTYPTMTGTVLAIAAAAASEGTSTITGASVEPSCDEQVDCLRAMGTAVHGTLPELAVTGQGGVASVDWRVAHDRIHAVTYATAALLTRGRATVVGSGPMRIPRFVEFLRATGCTATEGADRLTVEFPSGGALNAVELQVGSEPLFSSDWAPLAALLLSLRSRGTSVLVDDVFGERFQFADRLHPHGLGPVDRAATTVRGRPAVRAVVTGAPDTRLDPSVYETCPDIRGSVAIAVAALAAAGPCRVVDDFHIRRGHTDLTGDLRALGVDARRNA